MTKTIKDKLANFFSRKAGFLHDSTLVPGFMKESCAAALWACYGLVTGTTLDGHGIDRRLKAQWNEALKHKAQSLPVDGKNLITPPDIQNLLANDGMAVREIWAMDKRLEAFQAMDDEWRTLMSSGMGRYEAQKRVIELTLRPHQ